MGLALVLGYESMGLDFAKPRLRADMEKSMAAISRGEKTYEEEKARIVREYMDAYDTVSMMGPRLEKAFQKYVVRPGQGSTSTSNPAPAAPRGRGRGGGSGRGRRGRS
jgi:DNA topoisomerase-3